MGIKVDIDTWLEDTEAQINELKAAMTIDRHTLDDAMERQPQLYSDVADLMAECISFRDQAKAFIDEAAGRLQKEIRKDAAEAGAKLTEKAIESEVTQHDDYLEAQENYLDIKRLTDRAIGLKDSFEQRSRMIKYLSEMYMAGYWTMTSARSAEKGVKDVAADSVRAEAATKRRSRSRKKLTE